MPASDNIVNPLSLLVTIIQPIYFQLLSVVYFKDFKVLRKWFRGDCVVVHTPCREALSWGELGWCWIFLYSILWFLETWLMNWWVLQHEKWWNHHSQYYLVCGHFGWLLPFHFRALGQLDGDMVKFYDIHQNRLPKSFQPVRGLYAF